MLKKQSLEKTVKELRELNPLILLIISAKNLFKKETLYLFMIYSLLKLINLRILNYSTGSSGHIELIWLIKKKGYISWKKPIEFPRQAYMPGID